MLFVSTETFHPRTAEDLSDLFCKIKGESPSEDISKSGGQILRRLLESQGLRSRTTCGDEAVASLEKNVQEVLGRLPGETLQKVLPIFRVLMGELPRIKVFGIDIGRMRDDSAFFSRRT